MSPPTPLPSRPSLEHLKDQAADLRRAQPTVSVAQSLFMVARSYGFESWPALKHHVETIQHAANGTKETPMSTSAVLDRKELYTFTQQLATLMMSGVAILDAFEICAETATTPAFKAAIMDMRTRLREGEGIASRFKLYPQYFDGIYVQMVAAGEETGKLDVMLDRLSAFIASVAARDGAINAMVIFTRQLATMQQASIPLVQALSIIADETADQDLRRTIAAMRDDVSAGLRLDEAMAKHPGVFDSYLISMVKAGSLGGNLDRILARTAEHLERVETFGKR